MTSGDVFVTSLGEYSSRVVSASYNPLARWSNDMSKLKLQGAEQHLNLMRFFVRDPKI